MVTIGERITELVAEHGSLRAVAAKLSLDVGYLSRLRSNEKMHPSKNTLEKLGLNPVPEIYYRKEESK